MQIIRLSVDKDGYLHSPGKLKTIEELAQLKTQQESLEKMYLSPKEMYQKVLKNYAHFQGENQVLWIVIAVTKLGNNSTAAECHN